MEEKDLFEHIEKMKKDSKFGGIFVFEGTNGEYPLFIVITYEYEHYKNQDYTRRKELNFYLIESNSSEFMYRDKDYNYFDCKITEEIVERYLLDKKFYELTQTNINFNHFGYISYLFSCYEKFRVSYSDNDFDSLAGDSYSIYMANMTAAHLALLYKVNGKIDDIMLNVPSLKIIDRDYNIIDVKFPLIEQIFSSERLKHQLLKSNKEVKQTKRIKI